MNVRHIAAALLLWGTAAHAGDLSPEQVARIRAEQQAADERVRLAHEGRKPSEMDTEQRRQFLEDQRRANQEVLDKHGVTAKEFARASSRMSREEMGRADAEGRALKERKATEKPSSGGGAPEVKIEYSKNGGDADLDDDDEAPAAAPKKKKAKKSSKRRRR
jgi:hypothetical protein